MRVPDAEQQGRESHEIVDPESRLAAHHEARVRPFGEGRIVGDSVPETKEGPATEEIAPVGDVLVLEVDVDTPCHREEGGIDDVRQWRVLDLSDVFEVWSRQTPFHGQTDGIVEVSDLVAAPADWHADRIDE